jgi:hypothetical protein
MKTSLTVIEKTLYGIAYEHRIKKLDFYQNSIVLEKTLL